MEQTTSSVADKSPDEMLPRRISMPMVQDVLLIWLDDGININSPDYLDMIIHLRGVVNNIETFTDRDQCVEFLRSISDVYICMIISDAFCQNTVSRIHDLVQLHTIFIFGETETTHEKWIEAWYKVKGVYSDISSIREALKRITQQCEHNAISISFLDTNHDISTRNLDQLDPSFMYTHVLKEILLTMKFQQQHLAEFIIYLSEQYVGNEYQLQNLKKIEEQYYAKTPIWWYTREPFFYSIVNRALRLMNTDIIMKMGFFIRDLHRHIETLHSDQFGDNSIEKSFTVYRGQGMREDDFKKLTNSKGGLISFENFLSTSKNRDISLIFVDTNQNNPDVIVILFVIQIDPCKSTTPFASIRHVSHFNKEDEVLFAMHSLFRIDDIQPIVENDRVFQVDLTLTSDNDKDLLILTDRIREEVFANVDEQERLGLLFLKMGLFEKAHEFYRLRLNVVTSENQEAYLYNQIGWTKRRQGKFQEAITFFEKSLAIYERILPANHPDMAWPYSNIGSTYSNLDDYSKALSFHEKALEIRQLASPPNYFDLTVSYIDIGSDYQYMNDNAKALSSYEKALEIRQKILSSTDPSLANCYSKIGLLYKKMRDYRKALSFQEQALQIREKSLPSNHSDLGFSYSNIGVIHKHLRDYTKALSFQEKALAILQQSLPSSHPSLAMSHDNIGMLYEKMGDYSKAHSFYERAVQLGELSLLSNSQNLKRWRENFENIQKKL